MTRLVMLRLAKLTQIFFYCMVGKNQICNLLNAEYWPVFIIELVSLALVGIGAAIGMTISETSYLKANSFQRAQKMNLLSCGVLSSGVLFRLLTLAFV